MGADEIFTEKQLCIDTDRIKRMCKVIIKMCDDEPHAVDSLLESAYIELVNVSMMMKGSADRAKVERAALQNKINKRQAAAKHIPELAVKYDASYSSKKLEKLLESLSPEEFDKVMARITS